MADEQTGAAIEDFLVEDRTFPPPESFKKDALVAVAVPLRRGRRGLRRASGPARPPTSSTGTRSGTRSSSGTCRSPSGSSAGSSTSATTASTATSLAGRGDKVAYHWEGEPGDTRTITYADLHAEVQRFANVLKGLGVAQGRPRLHLHADGPRAAGGDAGLRPHRRAALGRVRRLQPRLARSTASTTPSARSSSPPTAASAAARRRCSSPTSTRPLAVDADDRARRRRAKRGRRAASTWPEGRDHWWHDLMADGRRRVPVRADGQRGPALPALHVGHHGQAQGDHAHHRRLPHPGRLHPQVRLRPPPRHRRLLVRGRHRLGHRPQLHRLRAARQRRHRR